MPLGTEVGLGPGHIVLAGNSATPSNDGDTTVPSFGPCLLYPNGWMDQDATWYGGRSRPRPHYVGPCVLWPNGWIDQDSTWCGGRPRPRRHCIRWRPSSPMECCTTALRFSAHVYCGHTVAHLSNYWALAFFYFLHYSFCLVPRGRLSWQFVSFWVDVNIVDSTVLYRTNINTNLVRFISCMSHLSHYNHTPWPK